MLAAVWIGGRSTQKRRLAGCGDVLFSRVWSKTQKKLLESDASMPTKPKSFHNGPKQMMPAAGWDPLDSMKSVKKEKGTGKFVSLQKAVNRVPANILTQAFLRFAFGVSKETFRKWMGEGSE